MVRTTILNVSEEISVLKRKKRHHKILANSKIRETHKIHENKFISEKFIRTIQTVAALARQYSRAMSLKAYITVTMSASSHALFEELVSGVFVAVLLQRQQVFFFGSQFLLRLVSGLKAESGVLDSGPLNLVCNVTRLRDHSNEPESRGS